MYAAAFTGSMWLYAGSVSGLWSYSTGEGDPIEGIGCVTELQETETFCVNNFEQMSSAILQEMNRKSLQKKLTWRKKSAPQTNLTPWLV